MGLAPTISSYLCDHQISYQVINHPPSNNALDTAHSAQIEPSLLAKAVVMERSNGELVMILACGDKHIHLRELNKRISPPLKFVSEAELSDYFQDCDTGAIPGFGDAYGISTLVDADLLKAPEVYLEAGDHRELILLSRSQFQYLMKNATILEDL